VAGLCEHGNEPSGSIRKQDIFVSEAAMSDRTPVDVHVSTDTGFPHLTTRTKEVACQRDLS
jgi:hypothetical protein